MKRALVLVGVCLAAGSLALAQEPQTKTHTETTVKHSGPGPDAKTKMESVVGTVKEYEAGKKIKVTGPGDKDFSFDLDEGVGLQGNVAVGERVKVTYTKMPNGNKVTMIQPDHSSH